MNRKLSIIKNLVIVLLTFSFLSSSFAQNQNPIKQYLKKVGSPIYLDGQGGFLMKEFDFAAFHSLSGGIQISKNLGLGVDYMKGDSGNAYDHTGFTGTGLQLRVTKPRFIGRLSYGIINNGSRFDDSSLEYQYKTGNDRYFRIDTGYRFWKVFSVGISGYFTKNINLGVYETDYNTYDLIYLGDETRNTKGFTITLGLLLPPL